MMTQISSDWLSWWEGVESVGQQTVSRRRASSHTGLQKAKVTVEFNGRVSLLPERNAIGQSLRRHRILCCDWLKRFTKPTPGIAQPQIKNKIL